MTVQFIQLVDINGDELSCAIMASLAPHAGDTVTITGGDNSGTYVVVRVKWSFENTTTTCNKERWIASVYVRPA